MEENRKTTYRKVGKKIYPYPVQPSELDVVSWNKISAFYIITITYLYLL